MDNKKPHSNQMKTVTQKRGESLLPADRLAAVSPIMFSPKLKIDRTNFYRAQAEHYSEHYEGGWTINGSLCLK